MFDVPPPASSAATADEGTAGAVSFPAGAANVGFFVGGTVQAVDDVVLVLVSAGQQYVRAAERE